MPKVLLKTTHGPISLQLDAAKAPETTANFLQYVRSGFYAGVLFHRVIPGFMIQAGGMTSGMRPKPPGKPIKNEATNGLKNRRGSIAMARTSDPHSAGAQFFINLKDNDFLDHKAPDARNWGYCVFGAVDSGMETVDAIAKVATGRSGTHADVPQQEVTIESAEIVEE